MQNEALILISYAVGIFIVYALLARGLFRATEELRFSLLDLSEPLLQSDALTDDDKWSINSALSQVHSALSAWRMVFALIKIILLLPFKAKRVEVQEFRARMPEALRREYRVFTARWIVAVLGNSPLASFIFAFIIILLFVFVASAMPIAYLLLRQQSDRKAKEHHCVQGAH